MKQRREEPSWGLALEWANRDFTVCLWAAKLLAKQAILVEKQGFAGSCLISYFFI
jgi:hypothetical protein